jgi:hypothetical protein
VVPWEFGGSAAERREIGVRCWDGDDRLSLRCLERRRGWLMIEGGGSPTIEFKFPHSSQFSGGWGVESVGGGGWREGS